MKHLSKICIVAVLVLSVTGVTQAVDIAVPGDYTTIQDAINAASSGDTIIVAAGSYPGFTVDVANLTILGAQANVDAAGNVNRGDAGDSDESLITGTVMITADDVTLNGFKLNSSYVAVGYAHAYNVNISYNVFENVIATWGAIHLHGGTHEADGGYIGYNTISGALGHGIWTVSNDNVTIEYNHVLSSTGFAIEALNHIGTNIVIHGNIITNSGSKGINYWADDGGVITDNVITNPTDEAIYTDAQATISGNKITGGGGYGILVVGGAGGSTVSGNYISNPSNEGIQSDVQVTIINNDISGGYTGIQLSNAASGTVIDGNKIHDNDYWGLSIRPSVTDATVTNNEITNNPYCGVIVWGPGTGDGIQINYNQIIGNGIYGIESQRADDNKKPVDAMYNWWGHVSGPYHPTSWYYFSIVEITNPDGSGDKVSDYVLYMPWLGMGGFVTGGGAIWSEAGNYRWDVDAEGQATFGFVSKYSKGKNVPDGRTNFVFQAGDLNFHSSSYDWLVVTGSDYAKFKGTGSINGSGEYKFQIWAGDGGKGEDDTFHIKIWTEDEFGVETVVYDNGSDQVIAGGSIVVHTK